MWRMLLLLLLAALLFPVAARAQQITVRSGEHAGFSRLVLAFDASAGWRLGRTEDGWEFQASDRTVGFDTSRIFDLIPRTRIAAASSPSAGRLRIRVDCDCHVDAFELRRGRIVIDVKDGPAPDGNAFETPLDADPPTPTTNPTVSLAAASPEAPRQAEPGLADAVARTALGGNDRPAAPALAADFSRDAERATRSREFEARVLEELARAGSQGLIVVAPDGRPPGLPPRVDALESSVDRRDPPPLSTDDPDAEAPLRDGPSPAGVARDNTRVETAVDRDSGRPNDRPSGMTADGALCPTSREIDISTWGALTDGVPEIGKYRAALTGEFDEIDPDRAIALARYYVFLGFGAEALQMLELVPPDTADRTFAESIAEIMDHEGQSPVGLALDGYEACDSAASLWAVLAGPPLRPGQDVNEKAVIRAFAELPEHISMHLGPRLIDAFTKADRLETAKVLRNAIILSTRDRTVGAAIAAARLDEASGRPELAEATLGQVLAETDPDSPEALLELSESRLRRGEALEPSMIELLDTFRGENRTTPLAGRIDRTLAVALITAGDFRGGYLRIAGDLTENDDPAVPGLVRRLYLEASERADAAAFLRLVLPNPNGLGSTAADSSARLAIAGRLVELGFVDDAITVLGNLAQGDDPAPRLLVGRAFLAQRRFVEAAATLATLEGADAAALLAEAQEGQGNFGDARRLYARAGRNADVERMAIRENDWAALADSGDPGLRALAERLSIPAPANGPDPDPYQAARKLIEGSADDRLAIGSYMTPQP